MDVKIMNLNFQTKVLLEMNATCETNPDYYNGDENNDGNYYKYKMVMQYVGSNTRILIVAFKRQRS